MSGGTSGPGGHLVLPHRDGKLGFEATPTAEDKLSKSVSTRDKWLIGFSQ